MRMAHTGKYHFVGNYKKSIYEIGSGHMHDLINLLQVLVGFVGTVGTVLAVTQKYNKADYEAIIKELTAERDEFKKDYYRQKKKTEKLEEELRKI